MPLYNYLCKVCKREFESFQKIKERSSEKCCGVFVTKLFSPPSSKPITLDYFDRGLGCCITGQAQRRRMMKEKNLEEK